MKLHILFISVLLVFANNTAFAQEEFKNFDQYEIQVICDSISFDEKMENYVRNVSIKAMSGGKEMLCIDMQNYETSDSSTLPVLGVLDTYSYRTNQHKSYIWLPYQGLYYIGYALYLDPRTNIKQSYANYPDESVISYIDYRINPYEETKYIQSELRLDLSVVKTFPAYFKKLYEEKYGKVEE